MASRGNATSWSHPSVVSKQNAKSSISWVSREREQQSMDYFDLQAASKLKFLIFDVHSVSRNIK